MDCFRACPEGRLKSRVVHVGSKVLDKYCSAGADEANTKEFFDDFVAMADTMGDGMHKKCTLNGTAEEFCT
ncbi:hypothetical protein AAVH_11445 [Aphelenchoides avenae]|nr:hypothetical protein AAVH_11445 [Aphelenchus avenae]